MWPNIQPWDTLVYVVAAVAVVLLNRRRMLTREGSATAVVMPDDQGT